VHIDNKSYINFKNGKRLLFESFFKDNFSKLSHFAIKYLKDVYLAEDIVQESFVKIWESDNTIFDSEVQLLAFIYTIVRNKCLNSIEHTKTKDKYSEEVLKQFKSEAYLEASVLSEETDYIIYKAIKSLTPQCSQVIKLHLKGIKNKEIAKIMKISISTVKSHKMQAYKLLRKEIRRISLLLFILSKNN